MESTSSISQGQSRLLIDQRYTISDIDDRLFGSFVEHLGRCVYTGLFEPEHPDADEYGFRKDVIALVKELGVSTVRYPGGNYVSGYRWRDGIGDPAKRPRRLDLAWHSTETNQFGLHEMEQWLAETGGNELMEAVNLGTQGFQEALDLLEYSNIESGTALSDLRRSNGAERPFDIRMWCLGNEMDGPWQLGHCDAVDYARMAAKAAAGMKQIDPDLDLVVCGSSSHSMETFGDWERTVLERTYDYVDFISCHAYYQPKNNDIESFLASGVDMNSFIKDVAAIIDSVKATRHSNHQVYISFDEWNVWYQDGEKSKNPEGRNNWPVAPRLLEDVYTVTDAVVLGDLLITLLQNADTVHSASLAQLVNVIAPIMTEPMGDAWRQTIFYPFASMARYAKGGTVLRTVQESTNHNTQQYGDVADVNSVTVQRSDGSLAVFVVNRSMDKENRLTIDLPASARHSQVKAYTLHEDDLLAVNTLQDQNRVILHDNPTASIDTDGHQCSVALPAVSWTMLLFN